MEGNVQTLMVPLTVPAPVGMKETSVKMVSFKNLCELAFLPLVIPTDFFSLNLPMSNVLVAVTYHDGIMTIILLLRYKSGAK